MSHHQTSPFLAHLLVLWKVDRVASVIHNTVRGRVGWTKKYNKILKNFRLKAFFYLCLPDDLRSIYRVSDEIQEIFVPLSFHFAAKLPKIGSEDTLMTKQLTWARDYCTSGTSGGSRTRCHVLVGRKHSTLFYFRDLIWNKHIPRRLPESRSANYAYFQNHTWVGVCAYWIPAWPLDVQPRWKSPYVGTRLLHAEEGLPRRVMLLWSLENLTVHYFLSPWRYPLFPQLSDQFQKCRCSLEINDHVPFLIKKKTLAGHHVDNGTSIANRILRAHAVRV